MLKTLVIRSLVNNARISAWTLATLTTCAALVTLFTTATVEVGEKMSHALRRLGANAVAYPATVAADWQRFDEITKVRGTTAALLETRVGMIEGRAVAVVSADPQRLARLTSYWSVTGRRATAAGECLLGRHAAEAFRVKPGQHLSVAWPGEESSLELVVTGIMETGDEDDNRVFVAPVRAIAQPRPAFAYALVAVPGGEGDIRRLQQVLKAAQVGIEVKPLRQVLHGERQVLGKISLLFLTALSAVLALTALGVSASMLARVVERRKEFALLQAIGARRRAVVGFLLAESATVGVTGAIVGFGLGTLLAAVVVWQIFHVAIVPHWLGFAAALATTVLVSLLAGGIACGRTLRFRTATALRGE